MRFSKSKQKASGPAQQKPAIRRVTYRLYPTVRQEGVLLSFLELHRELYNAALQERRGAYRLCKVSIGMMEQWKAIPEIKAFRPDVALLGTTAMRGTIRRVDLAFGHFFRRCREGAKHKGYPRFKSKHRFRSFTYPDTGGWALSEGKLRLFNVGLIKLRGKARTAGRPTTCTILHRHDRWYASITLQCSPQRESLGTKTVGIDLGLEKLATLSDGQVIDNPRHMKQAAARLAREQRALSRKRRGSGRYARQRAVVAREHEKLANIRADFLHKQSARLVRSYAGIAIERMNVANLQAGGGPRKRALNRSIADAAWGMLYHMIEYKSSEARIPYVEVDPRTHAPSQACNRCGARAKKALSERVHSCATCGERLDRDHNSAIVIHQVGFGPGIGRSVEGAAAACG